MALADQVPSRVDRAVVQNQDRSDRDTGIDLSRPFMEITTHCVPCGMMAIYMQRCVVCTWASSTVVFGQVYFGAQRLLLRHSDDDSQWSLP